MASFQREIVIAAPPDAVFALLAQPERLPEWTPGVIVVKRTSPGPIGLGATTETLVEAFGVRQVLLGRCTAFEAARRLTVENETASGIKLGPFSIGKITSTSTSVLTPEGAGTRLAATLTFKVSAGFVSGAAESMVGPQMRADFDRSLENLKRLLEQPAAPD